MAEKKYLSIFVIIFLAGMLVLVPVVHAQDEARAGMGGGRDSEIVVTEDVLSQIDESLTLNEIAHMTGIRGRSLAHELLLPVDVDKDIPVSELGVTRDQIRDVVEKELHHESSEGSNWKYLVYALVVLFAGTFLLKFGIPKQADRKKRKSWYPQWVYITVLAISVLVTGFLLGKSPNPMESVVKVPKATLGLYESVPPYVYALLFFIVLAIVVNKAVCGWACPFGALEELIYTLPFFKKAKKWQMPFWISNTVRGLLFITFLVLIYGLIPGVPKGFVVYHYANPFNLFNFDFTTSTVAWFLGAYLVISFFFYRPYCRIICPFGFLSWITERISLSRIQINRDKCIDCRACAKACPLTAAKDRLDKTPLPADCFACMRCLRVCPTDAIDWKWAWKK